VHQRGVDNAIVRPGVECACVGRSLLVNVRYAPFPEPRTKHIHARKLGVFLLSMIRRFIFPSPPARCARDTHQNPNSFYRSHAIICTNNNSVIVQSRQSNSKFFQDRSQTGDSSTLTPSRNCDTITTHKSPFAIDFANFLLQNGQMIPEDNPCRTS